MTARDDGPVYASNYRESWALIIGIDAYQRILPLTNAANDANAVSRLLTETYGFDRVTRLVNEEATKGAILKTFLGFVDRQKVHDDDRLLFFFAGHGHTVRGNLGDAGFLVPVDGEWGDLDSLIRWDELMRNSDLIPAKHAFFIMDACYSGLALRRGNNVEDSHFTADMLRRYGRQVLTAGKADEVVADGEAVRPGHSIFTAYLLEGLEGKASTERGIVTAGSLMAYVYDKLSSDLHSNQTPHYGFLEGDGDFLFGSPFVAEMASLEAEHPGGCDHAARLEEGVASWNDWRIANPYIRPRLAGAALSGLDLSRAFLGRANLAGANLSRTCLESADLSHSILAGANLSEAKLGKAILSGADLTRVDFDAAVFDETEIFGAKLWGARNLETTVHHGRTFLDDDTLVGSPDLPERFLLACGLSVAEASLYRERHGHG